jgi:SAM-dependent methyltransferase
VKPDPGTGGDGRLSALTHRRTYFDELYRRDRDPWGFEVTWYEHRKRDVTLAALPNARYRRGVEPGCSIGTLTERLAERVDELIAFDFVPEALETARRRIDRPDVTIVDAEFPLYWPVGTGDLVVWSEVAYYLTDAGFDLAMRGVRRWLEPGGHLLAVHYTGATDYPRTGRDVAMRIEQDPALQRVTTMTDPHFELAVWERRPE